LIHGFGFVHCSPNSLSVNSKQPHSPWVLELKARAELVEEKFLQNPEAALAQLEAWKEETKRKLNLDKYY